MQGVRRASPRCQQSASNRTSRGLASHVLALGASPVYLRRHGGEGSDVMDVVEGAKSSHGRSYRFDPCHAHPSISAGQLGYQQSAIRSTGSAGLGHASDMLASGRNSVMQRREEATQVPCGSLSLGATVCFVHSVLVSSPNAANWVWRLRRVAVATRTLRSAASSGRPPPAARPTACPDRPPRAGGLCTPRWSWRRCSAAG